MDLLKHYIVMLLAGLSLTSCYTDFEPDQVTTPVLCMNSCITAGEPVSVELTRTWRYSEGFPSWLDLEVTDATVTLDVNGSTTLTLSLVTVEPDPLDPESRRRRLYQSDYRPAPGDHLTLTAVSPTRGTAVASVTVPHPVAIDSVAIDIVDPMVVGNSYSANLNALVWFTDPAATDNYYLFGANAVNVMGAIVDSVYVTPEHHGMVTFTGFDYDGEPLFGEHESPLESVVADSYGYSMFTDRQINGRAYPLHINLSDVTYYVENSAVDPDQAPATINLSLHSISRGYYDHMLSVWTSDEGIAGMLGNVGLGDAVFSYSNVSTGAGIVAARATSTHTIDVYRLLSGE